ncbi:hypothetical protein [Nocardia sp. NPDC047654]|uniref:hypothetical protein n=1 Tax=Nocardia sp. NPDC047654 TaxID=3364314 RepID=UPI00371190CA
MAREMIFWASARAGWAMAIPSRQERRDLVNFSAYNYLHPRVVHGAKKALDQFGASASASRIVAGEIPLYEELERRLADIYSVGDAMVTTSGYLTNAGVIGFRSARVMSRSATRSFTAASSPAFSGPARDASISRSAW